jgi:diadenosine tetraphosphatase ApaH/serine/threonine PP2A family protein phosphatase
LPEECLNALESLGTPVRFIRGNGDREVVGPSDGDSFADRAAWCAARLSPEQRNRIAGRPMTVSVDIADLDRVLFCHAVPDADTPILTVLTPDDEVAPAMSGVEADVVVCGHVRVQYDRTLPDGLRVVNAGSVGAPYEGRAAAYWLLLGPGIESVSTPYDVAAAVEKIEATGCPDTGWIVQHAIVAPLGRDEVMEKFEDMRRAGSGR